MMIDMMCFFETPKQLAKKVADEVILSATDAIEKRDVFHWALAGGTSPKLCYELLRDADMDWSKVHIWFGDERCLDVANKERNDVMADEALLKHVDIPESQIHRIAAEHGAMKAANAYAKELASIAQLDLVLLGMGEDGHTASLFPENPALELDALAVPVFNAPKPPSERVSMGYRALNAASRRIIMVAGAAKKEVFERIQAGEHFPVVIADSEWFVAF